MYEKHVDTLIEAWNTGKVDLLDEILAPNVVRIAPESINPKANSLSEFKTLITDFRKAFPDTKVTIIESFFTEGHSTVKWNFKGTNTGPGRLPQTGKSVDISGVAVAKYENGKLQREEVYFDALQMLSQLGHLNVPKAASA